MSNGISAGDVVQLKSGGPEMTVTRVETESDGTVFVYCAWFEGKKPQKDHFPPHALVKVR